jgi:hypothetical protein
VSAAEADLLLDLALGALPSEQVKALEARLAGDARLAAEQAALGRLRSAALALRDEAPEAGAAQRIALRVRDQVAHEEHRARRAAPERGGLFGLTVRSRVRLLLASVAVHVLVLGWLVFRTPSGSGSPSERPVDVAIVTPPERLPPEASEVFDPLDLGPIIGAEQVPDDVLVDVGWVEAPAPAPFRVVEHPEPVQLEMLARSRADVRTRRLARAGATAAEATAVVARGLDALARLQRPDGSFSADLTLPPERRTQLGTLGVTALATLPFLAEGRRSTPGLGETVDPVVRRAIEWLRAEGARDPGQAGQGPVAPDDLALLVVALSEDYMLSYGRLPPAETAQRGREIARQVERLTRLQQPNGTFRAPGSTQAGSVLWPLLALDAARHTGLAVAHDEAGARLQAWIARQPRTAEGLPANAAGRADPALAAAEVLASRLPLGAARQEAAAQAILGGATDGEANVGTLAGALALYRADTPSFARWNRAASEALLRRVVSQGLVARGDAVVDSALTLLALQAAYRLY